MGSNQPKPARRREKHVCARARGVAQRSLAIQLTSKEPLNTILMSHWQSHLSPEFLFLHRTSPWRRCVRPPTTPSLGFASNGDDCWNRASDHHPRTQTSLVHALIELIRPRIPLATMTAKTEDRPSCSRRPSMVAFNWSSLRATRDPKDARTRTREAPTDLWMAGHGEMSNGGDFGWFGGNTKFAGYSG
jgi:hypothetical protein